MNKKLTQKQEEERERIDNQTVREYLGEVGCQQLRDRLEQFFNEKNGFVYIFTDSNIKLTDAYKGVCSNCVIGFIDEGLSSAEKAGLLWHRPNK